MSGKLQNLMGPPSITPVGEAPTVNADPSNPQNNTVVPGGGSGSSLSSFLANPSLQQAPQGTLRNFLSRVLPNGSDSGDADLPANATSTVGTQADTSPTVDYKSDKLLPSDVHPELRASILTGAGLDPNAFPLPKSRPAGADGNAVPGADVLRGAMKQPDLRQKEYEQADQSQEIADAVRPKPQQLNIKSSFKRKASMTGE